MRGAAADHTAAGRADRPVREGDLLWRPSADQVADANLTTYRHWLEHQRGQRFADYHDLWRWSVTDLDGFWRSVWDYFSVAASRPATAVLARRTMPGAQWFPGARLNFAEHVLRRERAGEDAVVCQSETSPLTGVPWEDFAGQVRTLATRLRDLGVTPGDRVVGYLPHVPETMVAMLAAASIGAVWATCSPDFGARGARQRFGQLAPTVLFCTDGYRYRGVDHDRRAEVRRIVAGLPSLRHVIHVPGLHASDGTPPVEGALRWDTEVRDRPRVPADGFDFAQVPFDHPLWILFSSGTTGRPKPIMHGHGGILLEHLKLQHLHMDLRPADRVFFFTTTGWMMWNFLACTLLVGAVPVIYDGDPTYPEPDLLWRLAQDSRAAFFGTSPTYVAGMMRAGISPGERYDLSALREVMPAGSPVPPQVTAWFYDHVKPDLWVATGSGGTDCCTGFVGGVPTLPVYAGEMQARSLGVAAYAFDPHGRSVVDEVGELVITQPMPSMPVGFWGDDTGERYRDAYFRHWPGVWRHGDYFRVNARGGCFVPGRSDATLNRRGVRIGTAEIYHAVEAVDGVVDSLVVNLDLPGGGSFLPLFVVLADGLRLDDALAERIRARLRRDYTPRHVPDRIVQVPAVPRTLTGKKMEVPVRRILLGAGMDEVADRTAMADPQALEAYLAYARSQRDYRIPDPRADSTPDPAPIDPAPPDPAPIDPAPPDPAPPDPGRPR